MASEKKDGRLKEILRGLATSFIQRESNYQSLITVTDVKLTERGKQATILLTVLPETAEEVALDFLKRKRSEFREFVINNGSMGRIPFFDFMIDYGEKNRQKIDILSIESKGPSGEVG